MEQHERKASDPMTAPRGNPFGTASGKSCCACAPDADKAQVMKKLKIFLAAGLALTVTGEGLAQSRQGPAPTPRGAPWQLDWGEQYCSLIRTPDEAVPFHTAMRVVPGSDYVNIVLVPRGDERLPEGVSSVVLRPTGQAFAVSAEEEVRGGRRVLSISRLNNDFREALAVADSLELRAGEELRRNIPLTGAADAERALRACTETVAREWSVDEGLLRSLSQRPHSTNLYGLRADDYPISALRAGIQGRVIVRIALDAEARPTECVAVASSGNEAIDAATCRAVRSRGRFLPALDARGQATAAPFIAVVVWRLPS